MAELDLSLLKNIPRKESIFLIQKYKKLLIQLRKKEAQEKALDKKVNRLDKVIKKTDKLIAKSKKDESKSLSSHNPVMNKSVIIKNNAK